jgi:hypothetical protein
VVNTTDVWPVVVEMARGDLGVCARRSFESRARSPSEGDDHDGGASEDRGGSPLTVRVNEAAENVRSVST